MDELIITVTVDSSMSYPTNPHCPPVTNIDAIVEEYVRSVEAGASICHIHGVHEGRLRALPPASDIRWELGRKPILVVQGRRKSELH